MMVLTIDVNTTTEDDGRGHHHQSHVDDQDEAVDDEVPCAAWTV